MDCAASIIAVVGLSAKIASLCSQYYIAVRDARENVECLQGEVELLENVVLEAGRLLDSPDGARLSASTSLFNGISDCSSKLQSIRKRLRLGKTRKAMRRLGVRALKWPFRSGEVDKLIGDLQRCKNTVSLALQAHQYELIQNINRKMDLARLRSAEGAAFDSHVDEFDARCHEGTREQLLCEIREWAEDERGKCIFWLNGMAGTGKSTIARTIAESFDRQGQLGASFFFKRGEGDRGNATRFFTTITGQLVAKVPAMIPYVTRAIDADPAISGKTMRDQFKKLIFDPLNETRHIPPQTSKLVIVVDALDECEREEDIRAILKLLSQTQDVTSVRMRIFVTSRPELPIRLGFRNLAVDTHQDLVLHDIPEEIINRDIGTFLDAEFARIRHDNELPLDWPGEKTIQLLAEMATPLFIFAATLCRFVRDPRWNPKERLANILRHQTSSQASKLDRTYLPVLSQLLIDLTEPEKERLIREFRVIVGSIVVLAEALPTTSLASLLGISKETIDRRLDLLHSVLSIPTTQKSPVRLLHLSFRDFLVDPQKRDKNPFWVDERETHERIAARCLELMSRPNCLGENLCSLDTPGKLRTEIDAETIDDCLPKDVQYACSHWVYHLEQGKRYIGLQDRVHSFLQWHFLHWLEALSLMKKMSEGVLMMRTLQSMINSSESPELFALIHDANRFIIGNKSIIENAPLQTYSSALVFSPRMSKVRTQFQNQIPGWIKRAPMVDQNWSPFLQALEGHTGPINAVAFSRDGRFLVSASGDCTVRIWDTTTGALHEILKGHKRRVNAVAFSWDDGRFLASASADCTIRLWDPVTGASHGVLQGHKGWFTAVAFSPDCLLLASASGDHTVWLWDPVTKIQCGILKGHKDWVNSLAFSPDSRLLASASSDHTIRLWNPATATLCWVLEGHTGRVNAVAFSQDGQHLASASGDRSVRLWDPATGMPSGVLEGHRGQINAVAFSHDGQLVSASSDRTVRLWDPATGVLRGTLDGHTGQVNAVAFSQDGQLLASASGDCTVRIWDPATGVSCGIHKDHAGHINAVAFSQNSQLFVSASVDCTIKLWDPATGAPHGTLKGHTGWINAVAFSWDDQLLASASGDCTVRLWDPVTGALHGMLQGHAGQVNAVAFSWDNQLLASASDDHTVRVWDIKTKEAIQTFTTEDTIYKLSFSTNGLCLETNQGDLLLNHATRSETQSWSSSISSLYVNEHWITLGGKNILWLPPHYRSGCIAVRQNILAMGLASGRVIFTELDPDAIPQKA